MILVRRCHFEVNIRYRRKYEDSSGFDLFRMKIKPAWVFIFPSISYINFKMASSHKYHTRTETLIFEVNIRYRRKYEDSSGFDLFRMRMDDTRHDLIIHPHSEKIKPAWVFIFPSISYINFKMASSHKYHDQGLSSRMILVRRCHFEVNIRYRRKYEDSSGFSSYNPCSGIMILLTHLKFLQFQ
jgi:hypothetical protein